MPVVQGSATRKPGERLTIPEIPWSNYGPVVVSLGSKHASGSHPCSENQVIKGATVREVWTSDAEKRQSARGHHFLPEIKRRLTTVCGMS